MMRIRSQRVSHIEELIADHAEQGIAVLAVALAKIISQDGEWIVECKASSVEAHAVSRKVGRSFVIVPLELVIAHDTTASPYVAIRRRYENRNGSARAMRGAGTAGRCCVGSCRPLSRGTHMPIRANERVAWFNGEFVPESQVRI